MPYTNWRMVALLSKHRWRVFWLTGWILIVLLSGCSLMPMEEEGLAPPLVEPLRESFELYEVARGDIVRRVAGNGHVVASHLEYLHFTEARGRIAAVNVKAGDHVQKGDVLIQLNLDNMELQLKQRELEVKKKQMALEEAKGQRDLRLIEIRLLELDIAQMQLEETKGWVEGSQLVAGMDGLVTFVADMKPGDQVTEYVDLITIADPTELRLSYTVSNSSQLADVLVGMKAEVEIEEELYSANVVQTPATAPQVDHPRIQEQYERSLYLNIEALSDKLQIGDSARIQIVTQQSEDVLVIPRGGLRSYFGRNYVQIQEGESRKEIDVEIGIESPTQVEILSGLEEGQLIILP